jgi:adenylate cyclase
VYHWLGLTHLRKAQYEEALRWFREPVLDTLPAWAPAATHIDIAYTYALMGRIEDALQQLKIARDRERLTGLRPFQAARVYAGLDDREKLFEWLEKSYEQHEISMLGLRVDPTFDPVRDDPRFVALLKKMGLHW